MEEHPELHRRGRTCEEDPKLRRPVGCVHLWAWRRRRWWRRRRRSQQCSWRKSRGGDLSQPPGRKERCPAAFCHRGSAHQQRGERPRRRGGGRLMETQRRGRWRTQAARSSLLLCLLTGEFSVRSV